MQLQYCRTWSFFIIENFILSENRTWLISQVGDDGYHAAYGTLSTAAMGSIFYGYFRKVRDTPPLLWAAGPTPFGAKVMGFVCMSVGLGMMSQLPPKLQIPVHFVGDEGQEGKASANINSRDASGTMVATAQSATISTVPAPVATEIQSGWKVRCPFDFTDNKDTTGPVQGLERITRHPGLWSFGLIGLGNALIVPSLPQRAWLAMPVMVALIGGAHTDSRFRRGMGGTLEEKYDNATSNIPFLAMLSGRQGDVLDAIRDFGKDIKPLNAAIALGVSGLWVLKKGRGVKIPLR